MPVTKTRSAWVSGNLVFQDASGNAVVTVDGANRKLTIPNGASLDVDLAASGLRLMGVARFTFDPSADASMRTIAAHGLGVTLPDNAIVVDGFLDIVTTFASAGADAGTIALSVQAANDLVTATAISAGGNIWDAGFHAVVPDGTVTNLIKTTAAREITATVASQALTAGKLVGFLTYVVSD